jgi:hypothetical protein
MCAFQKFEGFGSKMQPKVSLRSTGQIGLSQGCLRLFGISDKTWKMELFWDPEGQLVGMKPTQDANAKFAVPVIYRPGKGGRGNGGASGQVSGRS